MDEKRGSSGGSEGGSHFLPDMAAFADARNYDPPRRVTDYAYSSGEVSSQTVGKGHFKRLKTLAFKVQRTPGGGEQLLIFLHRLYGR